MLREGIIGDVLVSKAWNVQRRGSIGKAQPGKAPSHVDYDMWVGPAEFMPYQSNRFHLGHGRTQQRFNAVHRRQNRSR